MSTEAESKETLERSKRATLRSIISIEADVNKALEGNPSTDLVSTISSLLDGWEKKLEKLSQLDEELLEMLADERTSATDTIERQLRKEAEVSSDYLKFEKKFLFARGKLRAMQDRLSHATSSLRQSLNSSAILAQENVSNTCVKLPDIPVPKFDGKIENFTEWFALFNATIHRNERLSDIQKLYFLRQAMTGSAADVLKDYPIDEKVYPEAYRHVEQRFFNKRIIIAKHFADLVDLSTVTYSTIRESLDKVNASVRGLKVCGIDVAKMSTMFTFLVSRKLPDRLRSEWETSQKDYTMYPSFDQLTTFLSDRCFAYESTSKATPSSSSTAKFASGSTSNERTKAKVTLAAVNSTKNSTLSPRKCTICGQEHYASSCSTLLAKPVHERIALVKDKRLCLNCLRPGHINTACRSSNCRTCGKNHHTSLHENDVTVPQPRSSSAPAESLSALTIVTSKSDVILLPTAVVKVRVKSRWILARVLVDACSQVNLVTEAFVKANRFVTRASSLKVIGVSPQGLQTSSAVSLTIQSRTSDYQITIQADIVGKIPYEITPSIIRRIQSIDPHLSLADSDYSPATVDILIGGEFANHILLGNKQFYGDLCLEQSTFGWITSGPINHNLESTRYCHLSVTVKDALSKFWEIEEVSTSKTSLPEYELCEQHFDITHTRFANGRFQIRLPFKPNAASLADTYAQAKSALIRCESKLDRTTRNMYISFMKEYRELCHMEKAPYLPVTSEKYFIPHLPVLRLDNTTTPLRVVFNASARNKSGLSLNDVLLNGPVLQPELFECILQFRKYPVAFSADISKMYRQIDVHPDDRKFQLILWRDNTDSPITTYQLTTLTYGTTPAAYIATKCLQVVAKEVENTSPEVAYAISSEFYMDNLLSGANTHEDAIEKASKIHSTLMAAQLLLRKYLSNSTKFLKNLDSSLKEPLHSVSFTSSGAAKMLGLQWHPAEDEFRVDVKPVDITKMTLTKRAISSLIASIFDPLGFVAPVTVRGKILLQDLWREELTWDDPVPEEIQRKFQEYYTELKSLPRFAIHRPYSTEKSEKFEIIGFCDASERAYGAVVYVKTQSRTSIACAKTKVAPVKAITIPRLELLGAVLLVKLLEKVSKVLEFSIHHARVYCDSTIVLAWLKNSESKLEVFVRNRVHFINERLLREQWSHVKSNENPADLLTRGISVKSLVESSLWSNGPTWLMQELEPINANPTQIEFSEPIERTALVTCKYRDESLFTRYSDFDRLIRVTSQIHRFLLKLRPSLRKFDSLNDSTRALYVLCAASQHLWFENEIATLRNNATLSTRCPLAALDPFIDQYGVLRVGGRLRQTSLSYDTKHPIILHSKSQLAVLYVKHVHEKYFHATRAFTSAHIRSRFWLIGGTEKLVKKTSYQCVWCTRMKAETSSQIMGDLPSDRTTIARPFTVSGVDFAGPFQIRCTNHRTHKYLKHYAAFFVCFTTRAVHIESVSDLSTEAFIAALKRFVARRGVPNTLWSDNGTNFVGAKNILVQQCDQLGSNWKFIPPRSPNHGGVWESGVKAGKKLFLAAARGATLTEDQFKTVLAQVEAILNSRPMYKSRKTSDLGEIDVITPGHFLVGSNLLHPDLYDYGREPIQKRLLTYQRIITSFWRTWTKNYVAQLQRRSKWKTSQENVKTGDVVLMKIESTPLQWPLAKVISVMPDRRGKVRILTLKCGSKEYTRTIQQIVRLPVS